MLELPLFFFKKLLLNGSFLFILKPETKFTTELFDFFARASFFCYHSDRNYNFSIKKYASNWWKIY